LLPRVPFWPFFSCSASKRRCTQGFFCSGSLKNGISVFSGCFFAEFSSNRQPETPIHRFSYLRNPVQAGKIIILKSLLCTKRVNNFARNSQIILHKTDKNYIEAEKTGR